MSAALQEQVGKLITKAEERGLEVLRDKGPDWLEQGLRKTEAFVEGGLPLGEASRREISAGINRVRESGPDLVELGLDKVRDALVLVHGGETELALEALGKMTYQERRKLFREDTEQAYEEGKRRAERIEAFERLLKDLGERLLKALVPLLLAAIGI